MKLNELGHTTSAMAESVFYARSEKLHNMRVLATGALMVTVFTLCTSGVVQASNNLEAYSKDVSENTNVVVDIISYICYIGGAILAALGIVDLKKHVEAPTQTKMKDGLAKLGFGGMLLGLPYFTDVIQDTMTDDKTQAAGMKKFGRSSIVIQ